SWNIFDNETLSPRRDIDFISPGIKCGRHRIELNFYITTIGSAHHTIICIDILVIQLRVGTFRMRQYCTAVDAKGIQEHAIDGGTKKWIQYAKDKACYCQTQPRFVLEQYRQCPGNSCTTYPEHWHGQYEMVIQKIKNCR